MEKEKIIKQIERLCEKQYRKGFQQGFHTCKNNQLTTNQVDEFRLQGQMQLYSKIVNPHNGHVEIAKDRLSMEMGMPNMQELYDFINNNI